MVLVNVNEAGVSELDIVSKLKKYSEKFFILLASR